MTQSNRCNISYNYFHSNSWGIYVEEFENIEFYRNILKDNNRGFRFWNVSGNTSMHYNDIYGNDGYAISVTEYSGYSIDATQNYWGSKSGPYHSTKNRDGKGDEVSNYVIFDDWTRTTNMELLHVKITSHKNDKSVIGVINLSGIANDEYFEITEVQISIDGGDWIEVNGTDNWYFIWNTTDVKKGKHKIQIRAFNGRYHSENRTLTLYVNSTKEDSTNRAPIIIVSLVSFGLLGIVFYREDLRFALLSSLSFPLYTKLERSDILSQSTRNDIYTHISNKPGSNYSAIKKRLKIGTSSLVYHLNVLQREGFIRSKKEMGRRMFFPKTGNIPPGPLDSTLPPSPVQEKILEYLKDNGSKTRKEIEEALSIKRQTVSYSIKNLERKRLVKTSGRGRNDLCEAVVK